MTRERVAILAAVCAAMLGTMSAGATMLHLGFDAVVGGGFGGNLDKYEQTDPVALPALDEGVPGHRLDIPVTASSHGIQLLIVEFSATPDGFLDGWSSFNAYFDLDELAEEVFFSPAEKYFLISNLVDDVVIDATDLGLGAMSFMRITDVTGNFRPETDFNYDIRRYAQEWFWWHDLGDYAPYPAPQGTLSRPELQVSTLIPEPGTAAIALLAGVGLLRRRR